jgi:hypothetical protein
MDFTDANQATISEWIAFDAFVHYLETRLGIELDPGEFQWRIDEPPDFRFTMDGHRYGAEVTMIHDGRLERYAKFQEFVQYVRSGCDELDFELGRVRITMQGQPAIPNCKTKSDRKAISNVLVEMMRALERGDDYALNQIDSNSIIFERFADPLDSPTSFTIMIGAEYELQTRETVTNFIRDACKSKLSKLQQKGFPAERCVLLLYDGYVFSEPAEVIADTANLPEFRRFHSVAWIPGFRERRNILQPDLPGRYCQMLWSVNEHWNYPGSAPHRP